MSTTFEIVEAEGITVLVVDGQLGQSEVKPFDAQLDLLADRSGEDRIVDLLACPFITSLTVPCLLRAHDVAREAGGNLYVAAGEELQMVLKVLRLETRLNLRSSREACLEEVKAEPPAP